MSGKKEYDGGCHCGAIRYKLNVEIPEIPTATRCNCTICQKTSFLSIKPESPADFTLVKPASKSELSKYCFTTTTAGKYFCKNCGVHVWGEGTYNFDNKTYPFFSVNLVTLDQPQEGLDLSKYKITYCDGLNDNWFAGNKDHPWPHGIP